MNYQDEALCFVVFPIKAFSPGEYNVDRMARWPLRGKGTDRVAQKKKGQKVPMSQLTLWLVTLNR